MAQPEIQPAAAQKLKWNNNTCWIVLSYIGVLVHGLIGLSVVKEDDRVRFHCAQAVALSVAYILLQILFGIIQAIVVASIAYNPWNALAGAATGAAVVSIINGIVSLAYFAFMVFIIIKAFGGTDFRVPFFADFADKHLVKLFNKKQA